MNNIRKINEASYRVLKTLQCLFERDLSMQELVETMSKTIGKDFNNFVASKYINTCRGCGVDIQKINGKYALVNIPFCSKFTDDETELLYEIKQVSETIRSEKVSQIISNLFAKLHVTYFKSEYGLKSSINKRIIKTFEKALSTNSEINIIYENGEEQNCIPVSLTTQDKRIVFKIKTKNKTIEVLPDEIIDIQVNDSNSKESNFNSHEVIFELKGKLAKRYQLRENEQIIKYKSNGSIVISNKYEDRVELLRRLMHYDSLCKVLKPTECVDIIKNMIEEALSNYES